MTVTLPEILKNRRKEKNLKVKDVVDALKMYGVDIKEKTLYGWEAGHRQPSADEFLILCNIYGIESLSEVTEIEPEKNIKNKKIKNKNSPLDGEDLNEEFEKLWESLDERGKAALAYFLEKIAEKARVYINGE